jgi:hypothetical protein
MVEDRVPGTWRLFNHVGLELARSSDTPIGMGPFKLVASQTAAFRRPCGATPKAAERTARPVSPEEIGELVHRRDITGTLRTIERVLEPRAGRGPVERVKTFDAYYGREDDY